MDTENKIITNNKFLIKQGLEFSIPDSWANKVEIKEEEKKLIADYIKIPNNRVNLFTVNIWSYDEYESIKKAEGDSFIESYIIGKNDSFVFYLITPIDIDITIDDYNKYINDLRAVQIPFPELKKRFLIIK